MATEIEITLDETGMPLKYLGLTKEEIPVLVAEYVSAIETQETDKWCRCTWVTHPDDVEIIDYHCRLCNLKKDDAAHDVEGLFSYMPGIHQFKGKRKRKIDDDPTCPVHTKEGFLLYFFEWVFTREEN